MCPPRFRNNTIWVGVSACVLIDDVFVVVYKNATLMRNDDDKSATYVHRPKSMVIAEALIKNRNQTNERTMQAACDY